jgi:hypothetical protein
VRLLTKRSHELGHRRHPSIPGTPPPPPWTWLQAAHLPRSPLRLCSGAARPPATPTPRGQCARCLPVSRRDIHPPPPWVPFVAPNPRFRPGTPSSLRSTRSGIPWMALAMARTPASPMAVSEREDPDPIPTPELVIGACTQKNRKEKESFGRRPPAPRRDGWDIQHRMRAERRGACGRAPASAAAPASPMAFPVPGAVPGVFPSFPIPVRRAP